MRGRSGNVVASIGFGVHRSWLSMDDLVRELAPLLQNTASEITSRIAYH